MRMIVRGFMECTIVLCLWLRTSGKGNIAVFRSVLYK